MPFPPVYCVLFRCEAKRKGATPSDHNANLSNPPESTSFMFYERFTAM